MRQFLIRWKSTGQGNPCRVGESQCYAITAKEALRRFRQEILILQASRRVPAEWIFEITGIIDESYMDAKAPNGVCMHVIE